MHDVIILGAGRIGSIIARDLCDCDKIKVTLADRRADYLFKIAEKTGCETVCDDVTNPKTLKNIIDKSDLVIGALPGRLGLGVLEQVIECKKRCIDISFMPEDPATLDERAKQTGSSVLFDFGVAPGMSNILAAGLANELDNLRQIKILVGGLPVVKKKPWEYAAPFSPADVIEEYTRPARIKINGEVTIREPLSGLENLEFAQIGTLEAFYTDGLRSLLETIDCPFVEEKTLRYPGHTKLIKLLRDSGFFGKETMEVGDTSIAPIALSQKLLEAAWHLGPMDDEFTVMRVFAISGENQPFTRTSWDLLDFTDRKRHETSMARTTGFPVAIAAKCVLDGTLSLPPGVHPPEACVDNEKFVGILLDELKKRGVNFVKSRSIHRD